MFLSSFLAQGALATLYFSQRLYYLPLALFGTSVAAASLPELSREAEFDARDAVRARLVRGFRSVAFTVLPSAFAFILFGGWIISLLFQRGEFTLADTIWVHATLGAYAVGLLAASSVKLFASAFHAMLDTRTPVKYAALALIVGAGLGAALMWPFYVPGLAVGGAVGSWFYLLMLWGGLGKRIGALFVTADLVYILKLLAACLTAGAAAVALETVALPALDVGVSLAGRLAGTAGTLATFGIVYLAVCRLMGTLPAGGLRVWIDRTS